MNLANRKEPRFTGRLVMPGCVGQGVLPLLLRHIDMRPAQITLPIAAPFRPFRHSSGC
jgi:homospermidine synthase